jgi:putative transposase
MRYTERNALRANLVTRAEEWPWCSLWIRQYGSPEHLAMLSDWPVPRRRNWVEYVNQPASDAELKAIRRSCQRGAPYGSEEWTKKIAKRLGLESTMRRPGRPKKQ